MRRSLLVLLTALLAIAVHVPPASACLNDRETIKAEKEFKSTYESTIEQTPQYQPQPVDDSKGKLLTFGGGAGTILLLGAVVIGLRKPRQK